eukprot:m.251901 g.251901  ORF g.251901 m.251901 type:complete len:83 (-) comp16153_c0_seq1:876-1124(-)
MTCTVKKNWIITKVLAPVVPLVQEIASSACTSQLSIGYCEDVYYGEYCLGNGGCAPSLPYTIVVLQIFTSTSERLLNCFIHT